MNGKRKSKARRSVCILLSLCLAAVLLGGCGKKQIQQTDNEEEAVEIPMILTVSPTSGKKSEQELVDAFNITYKGKYHIAVDWIMETEDDYRQNLKRLNVTDKLPAVITDLRMLPSYYRLMVEDHRIVDLAPYIEADQEWKQMIEPVVLDSCSEEDGSVYLGPVSTAAFSCSGIFWNEELFAQAGIEEFPQTWEEFYHAVSILQKHNLTVGVPETDTANLGISSGIGTFNRFLLQNGGAYYNAAQTQTLFDTKTAYQAFTRWTELYTEYGLDREFNFYNRFRSGEMPLGIQSFSAYNMLAQAAPEIRGLWSFTSVPGTRRADGTVDRAESSTVTGCIMLKNAKNPAAAWRLMEWWSREDTQADYGNELEATMGSAARYAAANVEAFAQLNWTNAEQAVLAEQRDSVVGIPEIPGSYFISRCLTNAFRNVVSSGENPVRSLNQYNKDINAEIARKRTEFGLD